MRVQPPRWSAAELAEHAARSAARFREVRLAAGHEWALQVSEARQRFDRLLAILDAAGTLDVPALQRVSDEGLADVLRYLAGPPVSDDDLRLLAGLQDAGTARGARGEHALVAIRDVLTRLLDPFRFPWIVERRSATDEERRAAALASSILLAAQRLETARRMSGKEAQESSVAAFVEAVGFAPVAATRVRTLLDGPGAGQFCRECLLGDRKADLLVRLGDTRVLAIECKVSNSAINSVKRVNNDAAAKAEHWLREFGRAQIVAAAVLSGVFKVHNLEQAQERGLALFWAHDLESLGRFIASARG